MKVKAARWGTLACALAGSLWLVSCRRAPEPPERVVPPAGPPEAAGASSLRIAYRGMRPLLDIALVPPDPGAPGARVIVAVGEARTAVRSADGGDVWAPVVPPETNGADFFAVRFADADHGWIASRDRLLHTADRGASWSEAARPPGGFYYFGAISAVGRRCFLIQPPTCGATVYCTDDGGAHWASLTCPLPRNDYAAVHFRGERTGWVAGDGGRIAATADGGASWMPLDVPNVPGFVELGMVTDTFGWARPGYGHEGRLWFTRTGGADWVPADLGIRGTWTFAAVQFLDARTGYVLVQKGRDGSVLLETRDGGASWAARFEVQPVLNAMAFRDAGNAWFAGADGCVYRLGL